MKLIVGLGNPGREYQYTRHNLGFLVIDDLVRQYFFKKIKSSSTDGMILTGEVSGQKLMMLMPGTYMNNSGSSVEKIVLEKGFLLEDVLVVCDDLNMEYGQLRLRSCGSAGGHNGLKSVIKHLKSTKFPRLRLGIGSPNNKNEIVDFVLGEFNSQERESLHGFVHNAAECCVAWGTMGIGKAMSQFNKRIEDE